MIANYEAPSWSTRRKAAKIMKLLRDQHNTAAVHKMLGLKNRAYVPWIENNSIYNGRMPPLEALKQVLQYYEANKDQPPFTGLTV